MMSDIKNLFYSLFKMSSSILFPDFCFGCRRKVSSFGTLCNLCWTELSFIEKPYCDVTGLPISFGLEAQLSSLERYVVLQHVQRLRSAVVYTGIARDMVHALKYNDRIDLAPSMASWMMRAGSELLVDAELIIPVPLHKKRFQMRMFNQSAELGRSLARFSKKTFVATALERIKNTKKQINLDIKKRKENVKEAFRVTKKGTSLIQGKKILLVDDVFTTGATISSVCQELYHAGAASVDVLTFARVLPKEKFYPGII